MRRCILYIIIAVGALAVPAERTDVADLRPVQTVALYETTDGYLIETDTGDLGRGGTVDAAYQDLMGTTPGVIYLDTAEFLLVSENSQSRIPEIGKYLKRSVRCCTVLGECDLEEASIFLSVHNDLPQISYWGFGEQLPVLDCTAQRIKFL